MPDPPDQEHPLEEITREDLLEMSRQELDQLRRTIAAYHGVLAQDVEICTDCGHVHVTLHLLCPRGRYT